MTRFRLSHQAERDLEEIADRNPTAAVRVLEGLLNKFALLGDNPLLGQLRPDLPHSPCSFTAGNFVILYKPATNGIEVGRVVHAARDLGALLRREEE